MALCECGSRLAPALSPRGEGAGEAAGAVRIDDAERTRCEVWTRVMGYHRPVSAFNAGKRSEHAERKNFLEQH